MAFKRHVSVIISLAAAVLFGVVFGQLYVSYAKQNQAEEYLAERQQMTNLRLAEMKTINVGDTLTDHVFEYLDGDTITLSSIVHSVTLLSVIQPGCGACLYELDHLMSITLDSLDLSKFIFISSSNPRAVHEIVAEIGISSPFLYDHKGMWQEQYRIEDFPFNIVVDSNLKVQSVFVGTFEEGEIREMLLQNSNHQKHTEHVREVSK